MIAWWLSLRPRIDRDWAVGLAVLPRVEIIGDTLRIRHFRNFAYSATGDPVPRYEERMFDLARLTSVDYFLVSLVRAGDGAHAGELWIR